MLIRLIPNIHSMPHQQDAMTRSLVALLVILLTSAALRAQSTFEVASIRPTAPGTREPSNLDLDPSDYNRYSGGPITASGQLISYILFAYKIPDRTQADLINKQLPAWASQSYILRATVDGSPTKDQIRLMVQSLLAERFHLKLH